MQVRGSGEVKDLELLSYNILFDLCNRMKGWVRDAEQPIDPRGLEGKVSGWTEAVARYAAGEGISAEIVLDGLTIEENHGQPVDRHQMAYIMQTGTEKWYLTATLTVRLAEGWIARETIYGIAIAI